MSKDERPSYEALMYARHLALEIERARFGGPFDPERWLRKVADEMGFDVVKRED